MTLSLVKNPDGLVKALQVRMEQGNFFCVQSTVNYEKTSEFEFVMHMKVKCVVYGSPIRRKKIVKLL